MDRLPLLFPFGGHPMFPFPPLNPSQSPLAQIPQIIYQQFLQHRQQMLLMQQMLPIIPIHPLADAPFPLSPPQPRSQMKAEPMKTEKEEERGQSTDILTVFPRIVTCSPSTAKSSEQSSPNSSASPSPGQENSSKTPQKIYSPRSCPPCPICGKKFSRQWLLQGHLRTHTGEKPFKCGYCSKSFADKSNKRAHEQTHSGVKPFECERCGKRFALKSYLSKHEESKCQKILCKFTK